MDTENLYSNTLNKALVISGFSFVLGLLFNYFFFEKVPGINFPIYISFILAGLFIVSNYTKKPINKEVFWLIIPLAFFSLMVFVRSSKQITILNIIASLSLLALISKTSFTGFFRDFLVSDYVKIFFTPFKFIKPFFQTLIDIFRFRKADTEDKTSSQIIKGIIMVTPIIVIFLLLFSSADIVFNNHIGNLEKLNPLIILRSFIVLFITSVFIGAFAYTFHTKEDLVASSTTNEKSYNISNLETSILLGTVNFLFFIFTIIQLTYLFGGEGNIIQQGLSYAEYARKGFFELIAVAFISLLLLLATEKYTTKKDTEHTSIFKILSTTLVIQVLVIIMSAFKRLSLYEEAYGFTTLRLYSHVFIILLAVIFILMLYKIYKDKRESMFAFRVFVSVILFLFVMNILNPDMFIARRNIERFEKTGKLDTYYLQNNLSKDAIPEIIKLIDLPNYHFKYLAKYLYWEAKNDLTSLSHWQSLNLSRMNANNILQSKMLDLEKYKDYKINDNDVIHTTDVSIPIPGIDISM